jgi:glutaredoxin-related protein
MQNNNKDSTKALLEQLLSELHKEEAKGLKETGDSFLQGQDGQFLGKIISNKYDSDSILNKYGTYGSKYSNTSIFNKYSQYGSPYGSNSVNNPYCQTPPKLFIKGQFVGVVSVNKYVANQIPTETFLYLLGNDINSIINKRFSLKESNIRSAKGESFLIANDNEYLGKLTSNEYDSDSLLNQFGPYGNEFSPKSIFNEFGTYGSEFSSLSPFNKFTSTPPKIFVDGQFYGHLTVNELIFGKKISPISVKQWIKENF